MAGEGHIPLACTPDPQTAAPISGSLDECKVEFEFQMRVTRVHEDPRVTKPTPAINGKRSKSWATNWTSACKPTTYV